jgi:hypothetical protein
VRIDITTTFDVGDEVIAHQGERTYRGIVRRIEVSVDDYGTGERATPRLLYVVRPPGSRRSVYVGEDDLRKA